MINEKFEHVQRLTKVVLADYSKEELSMYEDKYLEALRLNVTYLKDLKQRHMEFSDTLIRSNGQYVGHSRKGGNLMIKRFK